MNRREFVAGLAGAVVWPLSVHGQHAPLSIGFLDSGSPSAFQGRLAAFRTGLKEQQFIEGENIDVQYRWAEGRYDQLERFAADLVNRGVAVLVATGSPNAARAAQKATRTIPIVFANGGDPVKLGVVSNLARPEANITGISYFNSSLVPKRFELLRELLPASTKFAILVNPNNPNASLDAESAKTAATGAGTNIVIVTAGVASEFPDAFAEVAKQGAKGILINNDAYFSTQIRPLVALAAEYELPTLYYLRDFVLAGGLCSYGTGTNIEAGYRQAGNYVGRVLRGVKPADLPVQLSSRFEFAVNLAAAKKLNLNIPSAILARADEVIE